MIAGDYIYIDPDEQLIELIYINDLDVDSLCELLRCDATDLRELPNQLIAYIDGEGAWQGRQKAWELDKIEIWGPILIFKSFDEHGIPQSCDEDDLNQIFDQINFWEE